MAAYLKGLFDDLEKLLYGARSLRLAERQRLLSELNRRKFMDCPIADEHVGAILKQGFSRDLKPREYAYIEHASQCPVCFIINHLILIELEPGWSLDEFRRIALLHLRELKEKM